MNYALNYKEPLMNYLPDGRYKISNNAAKRMAKSYVIVRNNFLFYGTENEATTSAILFSLVNKANNLNVFQYLPPSPIYAKLQK